MASKAGSKVIYTPPPHPLHRTGARMKDFSMHLDHRNKPPPPTPLQKSTHQSLDLSLLPWGAQQQKGTPA